MFVSLVNKIAFSSVEEAGKEEKEIRVVNKTLDNGNGREGRLLQWKGTVVLYGSPE